MLDLVHPAAIPRAPSLPQETIGSNTPVSYWCITGPPKAILRAFLCFEIPFAQAGSGAGNFSFPKPGVGVWSGKMSRCQGFGVPRVRSAPGVTIRRAEHHQVALREGVRVWPCCSPLNHSPKIPALSTNGNGSSFLFSLDKLNQGGKIILHYSIIKLMS